MTGVQTCALPISQAFIIGKDFINSEPVCLILGDNIFYGHGLADLLQKSTKVQSGAKIFGYRVKDPTRYGVLEIDKSGRVLSIEEKPEKPKSNYAAVGIYFYGSQVTQIAESIQPSVRGELEITEVNNTYLQKNSLNAELFGRGTAWLDTGTPESMLQAANFVQTIQQRQGLMIACPEEIAQHMGFIDIQQVIKLAKQYDKSRYGQYLRALIDGKR